jgi:hypothetical protein
MWTIQLPLLREIHQPSSQIYRVSDRVVLLSGGQSLYEGSGFEPAEYFADTGSRIDGGIERLDGERRRKGVQRVSRSVEVAPEWVVQQGAERADQPRPRLVSARAAAIRARNVDYPCKMAGQEVRDGQTCIGRTHDERKHVLVKGRASPPAYP